MENKLKQITFDEWIDFLVEMCKPNEDWPDVVPEDYGFEIIGGNPYECKSINYMSVMKKLSWLKINKRNFLNEDKPKSHKIWNANLTRLTN